MSAEKNGQTLTLLSWNLPVSAPVTCQEITPEKVEKALGQIDDALNGVDADRKVKAKVRRVRKVWPEQLKKYGSQGITA